jgi:hypothetical protein
LNKTRRTSHALYWQEEFAGLYSGCSGVGDTSTQLPTYFVGNLEINALARDLKTKTGADMKAVHDRMLEHGSISTKYARQLLGL